MSTIATDINNQVKKYENHLTVCKIDSLLVPRIKAHTRPSPPTPTPTPTPTWIQHAATSYWRGRSISSCCGAGQEFVQPDREFVGSGMVIMYDDKKKLRRNKQKGTVTAWLCCPSPPPTSHADSRCVCVRGGGG
jgi:hypothetical protein